MTVSIDDLKEHGGKKVALTTRDGGNVTGYLDLERLTPGALNVLVGDSPNETPDQRTVVPLDEITAVAAA